jgi:monoamine oxidase
MSVIRLDIAIVGAGISGLAATRKVLSEMPGARVAVFDRADRPGGRLCSRDLGDGMGIVELGAGRFSPNLHPQLASLTAHYGQATKSFEYRLTPIHSGLSEQAIILMSEICNEIDKNYHSTELIQRHLERCPINLHRTLRRRSSWRILLE